MDRPSRRGASKAAKAEAAASKLKQLKEKGGKGRLDDIEEADTPVPALVEHGPALAPGDTHGPALAPFDLRARRAIAQTYSVALDELQCMILCSGT